jgi:hypothetical protein
MEMAVEEHRLEPPKGKCRCRKFIPTSEATAKVAAGEATWVVLRRNVVTEDVCSMCSGDPEVKNCANCKGTGKETINGVTEEYGTDIVLVSRPQIDEKKKKNRTMRLEGGTPQKKPAIQTPRTPTIESEHIEKAYSDSLITEFVNGMKIRYWGNRDKAAQVARERIEEYGELIQDARMFQGKNRIPTITTEPANNPHTGEGRDYDYGRAI